jgi:hypothetical protein
MVDIPVRSLYKGNLPFGQKFLLIDLVGCFMLSISTVLFLIGLQWGGSRYDWNQGEVAGLMSAGLVGVVLFIIWLFWKGETALIPARLLKSRVNSMIFVTAFIQSGATTIALYWLPFWFQSIQRLTPTESGLSLLPLIISQLVFSVICGLLVSKTGYYLPEVVAGNIFISVGAGLTSTLLPDSGLGEQLGYQVLLGAGRGLVLQLVILQIRFYSRLALMYQYS